MIALALAASALMIACSWQTGPTPQVVFGHDLPVMLEGGWKWWWGILPHRDYYSHMGTLTCFLVFLGIKLGGGLLMAMPTAVVIFAILILPACIYVTFTRMPPFLALLSSVALMATSLAPHCLQCASGELTYATVYNRWGYCTFLIPLILMLIAPPAPGKWVDALDGAVVGLFMVLCMSIKISYGALLIAALPASLLIVRRKPAYYFAALGVPVLLVASLPFLIGWDFRASLHDINLLAHARGNLDSVAFWNAVFTYWPDLILLLLLFLLGCLAEFLSAKTTNLKAVARLAFITFGLALSAALIVMANSPVGHFRESPVLAIGSFILVWEIIRICSRTTLNVQATISRSAAIVTALAYVLALTLAGPVMARNVDGLLIAHDNKEDSIQLPANEVFQIGSLKGLQIFEKGGDICPLASTYVNKVQDGLALIMRTGNWKKPVACLDFSNPFNVARAVEPPAGSPLGWDLDFLFSATVFPDERQVFNGADVVMIPKNFGGGNPFEAMRLLDTRYRDYLREHYRATGESPEWMLLQKK